MIEYFPMTARKYVDGLDFWRGRGRKPKVSMSLGEVSLAGLSMQPPAEPAGNVLKGYEPPPKTWSISGLLARLGDKEAAEPQVRMPEAMRSGLLQMPEELPAEAPPDDDVLRRADARNTINLTISSALQITAEDQLRYELALMAHNGMVSAVQGFAEEAKVLKLTVAQLVKRILDERKMHERRNARLHAIKAKAMAALDAAQGEAIGQVVLSTLAEINEES
jgi:hypothetical protein